MKKILWLIYILMFLTGLTSIYTIFNVGNPHSLLRWVIKTDGYDVYIAMGASVAVFLLGFFVFYYRQQQGYEQLLWMNRDRVKTLRKKGYQDNQIAEDLLAALGMKKGIRYNFIKKRLVLELSSMEIKP
jgi:hypothetical protein